MLSQMAVGEIFIWTWIKEIVGFIMEICNRGLELVGIHNLSACIILFTIVIYTMLLPLQIKSAKFQKLNGAMNPEIQAISKKYKNKTDNDSRMKQQQELSAVYEKYGTSPTGGCLQSLIQLPILFAVYRVLYNVEHYVKSINDENLEQISKFFNVSTAAAPKDIINEAWGYEPKAYLALAIAVSIPVLSGLFQWLSSKISMSQTKNNNSDSDDNTVASSMNTMMVIMPLFSIFICYSLPVGIGLYWTFSAVYRTLTQVFINMKMKNVTVEELVEKNQEKINKKRAKKGLPPKQVTSSAQINTKNIKSKTESVTKVNGEAVETKKTVNNSNGEPKTYSSIRDKAFMVSDYNERNNKKK